MSTTDQGSNGFFHKSNDKFNRAKQSHQMGKLRTSSLPSVTQVNTNGTGKTTTNKFGNRKSTKMPKVNSIALQDMKDSPINGRKKRSMNPQVFVL